MGSQLTGLCSKSDSFRSPWPFSAKSVGARRETSVKTSCLAAARGASAWSQAKMRQILTGSLCRVPGGCAPSGGQTGALCRTSPARCEPSARLHPRVEGKRARSRSIDSRVVHGAQVGQREFEKRSRRREGAEDPVKVTSAPSRKIMGGGRPGLACQQCYLISAITGLSRD